MSSKCISVVTALAFAVSALASSPSWSAETKAPAAGEAAKKGTNVDPAKRESTPQTQAVALAAMADSLVQYGDRNKDALAMITAARILSEIGAQETKRDKKTQAGKGDTKGAQAAPAERDYSPSAILERAKQYASGRKDLIALADEAAKTGTRGRSGGPGSTRTVVNARSTDIFNVTFRGGEPAMVAISGDGDTDLDLTVMDESGNVICRADGPGDDEICRWTPKWTGAFRIEVRNLGGVYNQYRLWTN